MIKALPCLPESIKDRLHYEAQAEQLCDMIADSPGKIEEIFGIFYLKQSMRTLFKDVVNQCWMLENRASEEERLKKFNIQGEFDSLTCTIMENILRSKPNLTEISKETLLAVYNTLNTPRCLHRSVDKQTWFLFFKKSPHNSSLMTPPNKWVNIFSFSNK